METTIEGLGFRKPEQTDNIRDQMTDDILITRHTNREEC